MVLPIYGAVVITVAAVAAAATAGWAFSSYLSSEIKESLNRPSETKESEDRSSETTPDLNCSNVDLNSGSSPAYYPNTKGNEIHDQHVIQGTEIHQTTYPQLNHLQASKGKDVRHNFKSKESFKQEEEVDDRNSLKSEAKRKLMADANKQIQIGAHISEEEYVLREAHLASLVTGVQAQSSQYGSKKVIPVSLKQRRQKNKQLDDQNFQKLKHKRMLKADDGNQISRHLTPNFYLRETIKIMSYNIWSIKYYKRDERMNAVNHLIEQHSPDIILLQEVTPESYIYFQSCIWWGIYTCSVKWKQATKQCFCLMLSKLPVEKFFYKQFVNTNTSKGISIARFTSKSNKMLAVATCHLKCPDGPSCVNDIERISQAKEAINLVSFSPNAVLGGDMNWDELTDGPFPLTKGWCDAWSDLKPEEQGYTYDTVTNAMLGNRRCVLQKRLDRFVCKLKDFDMIDIEIVGTEAIEGVSYKNNGKKLDVLPSDHYGLILTIRSK